MLLRFCNKCNCELTPQNEARNGYTKQGNVAYRKECKPCRSHSVVSSNKQEEIAAKRRKYVNQWKRDKGLIKEYPCKTCNEPCIKVYAHAFCSIKCRFLFYIEKTESCWLWKGGQNRRGYGKFMMNSQIVVASRASYELFKGPIGEGKLICHTCDNPPCVNPDHLWEGNHSENQLDAIKKGRAYMGPRRFKK